MCSRNETCRPGGTEVTPEAFWEVYEIVPPGRLPWDTHEEMILLSTDQGGVSDLAKEQWDKWNTRGRD